MAGSNFKVSAPFLTYLTIFKSRLGMVNVVLPLTNFAYTPAETLLRRARKALEERQELQLQDARNWPIFEFLVEKGMIGAKLRKAGRYQNQTLTKLSRWHSTDRS